jgi:hypothetical protein
VKVYVVVDTLGAGRIVGVFGCARRAAEIAAVDPCYYELHEHELDAIHPAALAWSRTGPQRLLLGELAIKAR